MGSLFSSKIPAPPAPPLPATIRDEINKVEQVPVINPNGSVTYITRALPLSAEEQAEKDQLSAIMQNALSEIQRLSSSGYQEDDETKRVLDQWQAVQGDIIGDSVSGRTRVEEDILARRGLGDSSVGLEVRRKRYLDEVDARKDLAVQRDLLGNQVRTERLGLQQQLYDLASSRRDAGEAAQLQSAIKGQSAAAALNAQQSASILDYYNASKKVGESLFSVFSSAAANSAGSVLGGNAAGSSLGSIFKRY